eukprot:1192539-Prorocentrum_minimum.AAC.2
MIQNDGELTGRKLTEEEIKEAEHYYKLLKANPTGVKLPRHLTKNREAVHRRKIKEKTRDSSQYIYTQSVVGVVKALFGVFPDHPIRRLQLSLHCYYHTSPPPAKSTASGGEFTASGVEFTALGVEFTALGVEFTASGVEFTASGGEFTALGGQGRRRRRP